MADVPLIMVRYRVRPEHLAENERLIGEVYEELHQVQPNGLKYATFRAGADFVHLAVLEQGPEDNPLGRQPAFQRFLSNIDDRCEQPPVALTLQRLGSYRFDLSG